MQRIENCLVFSIAYQAEEGLKSLDDHFIHVQISQLIQQILYYFLQFNFLHFTPQVKIFFVEKGNLKLSDSKMQWRDE